MYAYQRMQSETCPTTGDIHRFARGGEEGLDMICKDCGLICGHPPYAIQSDLYEPDGSHYCNQCGQDLLA